MIEYEYACSKCSRSFSVRQSIKDKPLTICSLCGATDIERVIYGGIGFSVIGEPTTVGQLADRNTKAMGKMELQERRRLDKEARKAAKARLTKEVTGAETISTPTSHNPIYGKCPSNIASASPERQTKYILEGR